MSWCTSSSKSWCSATRCFLVEWQDKICTLEVKYWNKKTVSIFPRHTAVLKQWIWGPSWSVHATHPLSAEHELWWMSLLPWTLMFFRPWLMNFWMISLRPLAVLNPAMLEDLNFGKVRVAGQTDSVPSPPKVASRWNCSGPWDVESCWWRWQESLSESKCGRTRKSPKLKDWTFGDWGFKLATPATPNGMLWSDLWYRQRGGDPFAGARDSCMNRAHPNWFCVQSLELKLFCKSFGDRCSFRNWAEPSSSHLVIAIQTHLLRLSATTREENSNFLPFCRVTLQAVPVYPQKLHNNS